MIIEDKSIFEGKSFSDLLKDIYNNSDKKKKQIDILVRELLPLVKSVNEAAVIVPLIKEYLEVGVKNDEQLVKMASIFQKYIAAEKRIDSFTTQGGVLTRDEKEQLLREVANELINTDEELNINSSEMVDKNFDDLLQKTQSTINNLKEENIVPIGGENNGR